MCIRDRYAARSGLSVVILEKLSAGGQMALTEQIDNYPGFEDGIDGFTLGEKMQQSAERFGAVTELAEVYKVSLFGRKMCIRDRPSTGGCFVFFCLLIFRVPFLKYMDLLEDAPHRLEATNRQLFF